MGAAYYLLLLLLAFPQAFSLTSTRPAITSFNGMRHTLSHSQGSSVVLKAKKSNENYEHSTFALNAARGSLLAGFLAGNPAIASEALTAVTAFTETQRQLAGTARVVLRPIITFYLLLFLYRIISNQFIQEEKEDAFGGIPFKLTEPFLRPTRELFPVGSEGVDPTPVFWVLGCSLINEILTSGTGLLAQIERGN
ncbi:hypothetical protein AAMO2058_001055500 [Amorphochlora amoebiformis]